MKTLFIAFFGGICCFLSACNLQVGHNPIEKSKKAVGPAKIYYWSEVDIELDKVLVEFKKDFQVDPRAETYKNLGASYLEQGELDQALVEFKRAIQADPRFVEAHYLLADVYSLKGERSLSLKSLDQAMALEGSYIIDTRIMDETRVIPQSTVIESTEIIEHILPPKFFPGPIEMDLPDRWQNLDPIDRP